VAHGIQKDFSSLVLGLRVSAHIHRRFLKYIEQYAASCFRFCYQNIPLNRLHFDYVPSLGQVFIFYFYLFFNLNINVGLGRNIYIATHLRFLFFHRFYRKRRAGYGLYFFSFDLSFDLPDKSRDGDGIDRVDSAR
jgi:hypothetical protein